MDRQYNFSKQKRLLSKLDYKTVFKDPVSVRSRSFTMLACTTGNSWSRLGIIVAKRFMKKAVDRNRIRRLIRESFRLCQLSLTGLDIVVLLRSNCADQPNGALYHCLKKQWKNLSGYYNKA